MRGETYRSELPNLPQWYESVGVIVKNTHFLLHSSTTVSEAPGDERAVSARSRDFDLKVFRKQF